MKRFLVTLGLALFVAFSAVASASAQTTPTIGQVLKECPDWDIAKACPGEAEDFLASRTPPSALSDKQIIALVEALVEAIQARDEVPISVCLDTADGIRVLATGVSTKPQTDQINEIADSLCEFLETAAIGTAGSTGNGGNGGGGDNECPAGTHPDGDECVPDGTDCPAGTHPDGDECVPNGGDPEECPPGQHWDGDSCEPNGNGDPHECPPSQHWDGDSCIDNGNGQQCEPGYHWHGGSCVADDDGEDGDGTCLNPQGHPVNDNACKAPAKPICSTTDGSLNGPDCAPVGNQPAEEDYSCNANKVWSDSQQKCVPRSQAD